MLPLRATASAASSPPWVWHQSPRRGRLTAGTFLAGKIHIGLKNYAGGRAGRPRRTRFIRPFERICNCRKTRLKTGTPPRIDGARLIFPNSPRAARRHTRAGVFRARPCRHAPAASELLHYPYQRRNHDIIRIGFDRSPMFTGKIEGVGARSSSSGRQNQPLCRQRTATRFSLSPRA